MKFNTETFRVIFRALYAAAASIWAGFYMWNITFVPDGVEVSSRYGELILGFVLGTLVASLLNFYFGGSDNGETTKLEQADSGPGSPGSSTYGLGLPTTGPEDIRGDE